MRPHGRLASPAGRPGAAAVELAILLAPLTLLLMIAIDFARVFYPLTTVTNCARNGALYASDPVAMPTSKYGSVQAAAAADGTSLANPTFTTKNVSSASGTDGNGNPYVDVTASYNFPMATGYLGFSEVDLGITVRMRVAPTVPD
jgi:Flp pilus assembly protein TadG